MGQQTGIQWCHATFNPWWGCEKVSPACKHCYLRRLARRVVANAGRGAIQQLPRWAHVMAATGLGSTSAASLCREHGFDPDEITGGER